MATFMSAEAVLPTPLGTSDSWALLTLGNFCLAVMAEKSYGFSAK